VIGQSNDGASERRRSLRCAAVSRGQLWRP
jgi:hypothetical protein